jgi:biotin carboxylase
MPSTFRLSSRMGLPTNGEELTEARRNKFVMGETVRAAGVRAVKQKLATTMADIDAFLADHKPDPFMCVVKPVESAGTDDVYLCSSPDEARKAFRAIYGKKNGIGLINDAVLIQEFLRGKEYVVDSVSLNGVHKVVAVWQYDKRSCNGANFIYHGMRLRNPEEPHVRRMIEYSRLVLDALKVSIGPSHMEIMDCADGPCLVEVGTRCHGGEGTWIPVAMECVGYSMEKVTLDAYVNPARWEALPPAPLRMLKYGWETDMVNRHPGIIRGYPGEQILRSLASFRSLSWDVKIGDFAPLTKDLFTRPGCVQLIHESEEQVDKDFEAVHKLEEMGLFDYSVICPEPPPTGAVVVVDPFSSGANLAAMVAKMGYKLIMLFSELDSAITGLVSAGAKVTPQATIQHDNLSANQEAAVEQTLEALRNQNAPILAIIAGAETGVSLADSLATRFRTRNNGERLSAARRDKYLMHQTVASKGVRAIRQARCESPADVSAFLREFGKFPVVVKPIQSSGSDSVMLCYNEAEALAAFAKIFGKVNNIGRPNAAALVQEYVEGPEFVIDTVSRDGKHKIVAVWEYDKRSVNGAPFVYHGMRLRATVGDHRMQSMIAYAREVLNALEIFQGPSHMEVIWTRDGPCLVEVGARCHGGEATWLSVVNECLGYNQLEATLDCYLRPDRFDNLPPEVRYPSVVGICIELAT